MSQCRILYCVALLVLLLGGMAAGQVEVTTNHNDAARTGANLSETILNTSNVNASNFGKLFTRTVDGSIYAQPLYLSQVAVVGQGRHNVVYVATEHDTVYAFDADSPAESTPLWKVNLGPAVPSADICRGLTGSPFCPYIDLVPEIGITSTPVIDTATGTLYVVAKTKTGSSYRFELHALDVGSGAEKFGGPVQITASVKGSGAGSSNGTVSFDALHHHNRPGLLLLNGVIYIAFGSVGEVPPFHGWVLGYDATSLQQVAVFNASPNGEAAGIWAGGQGLAAEGDSIFLATGNGTFDGNTGGPDWGSSFLRLKASQGLAVADYFTPNNQGYLSSVDLDVGAGGPVLLPNMGLLLGIGKDGVLRLVDKNRFGNYNAAFNNDVQELQSSSFFAGAPVFWSAPGGPATYVWAAGDYLKQYGFAGGRLQTKPLAQSTMSASGRISNTVPLSLSSNASTPGSGIVWATAAYSQSGSAVEGIVRAFDAEDVSHELWDSKQDARRDDLGNFAKFCPPTVANGKVYAPTFSGKLVVYGLTSGDFNLKVDPDTVKPGQSASATVQVIPQADGLTSPVSLSCSELPPGVTCTFTPSSLPPASTPLQSTLIVTTGSATASNRGGLRKSLPAASLLLTCLCVTGAPLARKRTKRALWLTMLGLTVASLFVGFGCGGGTTNSSGVSASSVPLTAKFSVIAHSGVIEHRRTITLASQ